MGLAALLQDWQNGRIKAGEKCLVVLSGANMDFTQMGVVASNAGVQDSLRHIVGADATEVVPRDRYRLVQTPQVFKLSLLRRAYEQRFVETFTDDASVVEAAGMQVVAVNGNRENIKLTTPCDMMVAKTLMECWTPQQEI